VRSLGRTPTRNVTVLALALILITGACSSGKSASSSSSNSVAEPGNCTVVDMAVSPEKSDLMANLATAFNQSPAAKKADKCVFVRPQTKSSGAAAQLLSTNWNEATDGPKPVIWSPAATSWGGIVDQRLADENQPPLVGTGQPFMVTPLVIAMPKPMADALGYPAKPIGWSDILNLATSQTGWADYGHPEWGKFKLGKTNPNFSTSGLNALIAQAYAGSGKTSGLSAEDLDNPDVEAFGTGVESSVVHYGDTTLTFLNNLYKADQRGAGLSYVSAVAVEEKSVIDYNLGNPDGILQPGERPQPPRVPLVAIYPKEGTLFSDSPLFVLDAPWVSPAQKDGAAAFITFVQQPDNQKQVLAAHFRPGNPAVPVGDPIVAANGVDPTQPQTLLEVPEPPVLTKLLDKWATQRKKARVALVLDVSGSMGDPADPDKPELGTKLDLAKQAIANSLGLFDQDDEVSFTVFSTGLGPNEDQQTLQLVPPGRVGDNAEDIRAHVNQLEPEHATPLYDVVGSVYKDAVANFDPSRINAVVVLTDGQNDDGNSADDDRQLSTLLDTLRSGNEGQASQPVRVFSIAYGKDADTNALGTIADASASNVYTATDPTTIAQVLNAVISNF
jgi:Ca-activated chloride channel family protein